MFTSNDGLWVSTIVGEFQSRYRSRSHRSDQEEFYQQLSYKGDVDLNKKLEVWEHFYDFNRPHGAHEGKTPYEALRIMIK